MSDLLLLGLLAIGVFTTMYVLTLSVVLVLYKKNKIDFETFKERTDREYREFEAMANKKMEEQRKEMNQSRVISHVNKELDKHFKE
ncbi:hypothetical protein BU080_07825 [Staphylococcus warneri]|uniref:Uncharacterized protein n=1 Tax=Staphylococcus warneri TaxID=1292 RepID=A0A2T4Q021_STAWA|nr:hypothetical protein [Staphylococcus warneri]PTI24000.1 hypothetical protein BU080_07825 [Staphylococcus warneri]PTI50877.1 hypothetical protein BU085_07035 [Staphylococcus warneri]